MNRQIRRLAGGLMVLYLLLFVQLNRLQVTQKDRLDAHPNNNRQTIRDFNRNRGPIVTADGVIVARSVPTTGDAEFDYQREYPTGDLFSHITGYTSFSFGSTLLEKSMNDVLLGDTPAQRIDAVGGILQGEDATGSVVLSLRNDVQQVAAAALVGPNPDKPRQGSVVVIEPATGRIIAMVSSPRFDPNLIAQPNTNNVEDVLTFYNAQAGKPLLANAYQERYMPGSAFKVITTAIAFENGVTDMDRRWPSERQWTPPQTTNPIGNYGGTSCGGDMAEVFARSCNIPFGQLAVEVGAEQMVAGARAWGIGEKIPIDLPGSVASTFCGPDSDCSETDYSQQLPLLAIGGFGQGNDQMVPVHMAMVAATVGNGGRMMKPTVVDATLDHDGDVLSRTAPELWKQPISKGTADDLTTLMVGVVNRGTGTQMQLAPAPDGSPVQAAAKTGTAQLATEGPERSNAWIIGFAPVEQPRYAIAVVIKGGPDDEVSASTGGRIAGPVAKTILDYLVANDV
jgi:peptidoglycan glycosyltransferase